MRKSADKWLGAEFGSKDLKAIFYGRLYTRDLLKKPA
jgi:hypothetical protein